MVRVVSFPETDPGQLGAVLRLEGVAQRDPAIEQIVDDVVVPGPGLVVALRGAAVDPAVPDVEAPQRQVVAVDVLGNTFVCGFTRSSGSTGSFPVTTGAIQSTFAGGTPP